MRNSSVACWYSWVMVWGGGLANRRMPTNMAKEAATPRKVYRRTLRFSSAGG